MSDNFYAELPVLENFLDITDPANYTAVPDSWYVAITDVKSSTRAIAAGRYKEVNVVGASSIVALLNVARQRGIELPFVFGGDGATVLLPASLREPAQASLLATQALARQVFGLHLRIALIPVSVIVDGDQQIKAARFRVSENYIQAMFTGGGLAYAERLLKDGRVEGRYDLRGGEVVPEADFNGLECRWQDVPSQYGETVSLLVMATGGDTERDNQIYRSVLNRIEQIYGTAEEFHPLTLANLHTTFNPRRLLLESQVYTQGHWLYKWLYLLLIEGQLLLYRFMERFKIHAFGVQWNLYKQILRVSTDFRKYDDTLRMLIAGDATKREHLTAYLDDLFRQGKLVYGIHVSDRALLTCLVFNYNGRQVHFADGADGGFALAAREMKRRLLSGVRSPLPGA